MFRISDSVPSDAVVQADGLRYRAYSSECPKDLSIGLDVVQKFRDGVSELERFAGDSTLQEWTGEPLLICEDMLQDPTAAAFRMAEVQGMTERAAQFDDAHGHTVKKARVV
ncbi:hypothetical protein WJX72_012461 [[Myrmecia] bisecta]|uniref:Uncharacterized protein n=1 Tax=[Myrmecia] bisecta TaxID=41462 RepID=A0AAW1PHE0_9CHLO